MKKQKPDKLPYLNPNERGIFDRIIATAARVRRESKNQIKEFEQERIRNAALARAAVLEREAREDRLEAQARLEQQLRAQNAGNATGLPQFRPSSFRDVLP